MSELQLPDEVEYLKAELLKKSREFDRLRSAVNGVLVWRKYGDEPTPRSLWDAIEEAMK